MRQPRSGREDTQTRLLEAGLELLRDQPVGELFNQIKAPSVARRAGLTPGAFYYHWGSQKEFVESLLDYSLALERSARLDQIRERIAELEAQGASLPQIAMGACRLDMELAQDDPMVAVEMGLWAKQRTDTRITERLRTLYAKADEGLVPIYERLLEASGLEPRPPFSYESIAAVLDALILGLTVRRTIDPDRVPLDLFGWTVLALLPTITRPRGDDGDLEGFLNALQQMPAGPSAEDTGETSPAS